MNINDIVYNITLNPVIVKKLGSNVDAIILLKLLLKLKDSEDNEGFICLFRNKLVEYSGLSENQIKKAETFLKKENLLESKIKDRLRYYKINYSEYNKINGINIFPSLVSKLNNNSKAALLLMTLIDLNQWYQQNLEYEIPSTEMSLSTGLDRKSMIDARDSLLGFNALITNKTHDNKIYSLNIKVVEQILKTA